MKRIAQVDLDNMIVVVSVLIIGAAAYFLTSTFSKSAKDTIKDTVNAGTNS